MTYKRVPKGKPGQLACVYGNTRDDGADLYFIRGEGVPKPDGHFLYGIFGAPTLQRNFSAMGTPREFDYGPSIREQLEARGYDITTLKFSIQKKVPA